MGRPIKGLKIIKKLNQKIIKKFMINYMGITC
jgi:hypothetical protein